MPDRRLALAPYLEDAGHLVGEQTLSRMKGVNLAGGTGSRLFPLTKVTNKHLLPVGHYPMIFHPIAELAEAGIENILIVTGTDHMGDVVGMLGSDADLGLEFTFRVQDRAGGIAEALGLARQFVDGGRCGVILGDNISSDSIEQHVKSFAGGHTSAHLFLAEVPDPERSAWRRSSMIDSPALRTNHAKHRAHMPWPASTSTTPQSSASSKIWSRRAEGSWRSQTSTTPTFKAIRQATAFWRAGGPMPVHSSPWQRPVNLRPESNCLCLKPQRATDRDSRRPNLDTVPPGLPLKCCDQ